MALVGGQDAPKRPEPERPDEAKPAGRRPRARSTGNRDPVTKRLVSGPDTTRMAREAAEARWAKQREQQELAQRLADHLGLPTVHPDLELPVQLGCARRDAVRAELVQMFGEVGPLVEAHLEDAGLCRALAVHFAEHSAGNLDASKEARMATVAGRGHLISAREYAAKNRQERGGEQSDADRVAGEILEERKRKARGAAA